MSAEAAEVVKGDRTYRHMVLGLYAVVLAAGFVAVRYGLPALRAHITRLGMMDQLVALRTLFLVVLVSFSPAAVYLIVVGRRILAHGCYPYPGRRVMFDTEVMRGWRATRNGRILVTLGTVFLVLMTASMIYTYVRMTGWINSPKLRRFWGPPSAFVTAPATGLPEAAAKAAPVPL